MVKCNKCGEEFANYLGLNNHERFHDKYDSIKNDIINDYVNNNLTHRDLIVKYGANFTALTKILKDVDVDVAAKKRERGTTFKCHSEETKEKLSKIRKKFLLDNPEKHPWKLNTHFISQPCEYLKKKLEENGIPFTSELTPLKNKNYSIDIAFPNEKIGLEINGNQHYKRNGELMPYYKQRKIDIENDGWLLIDIHYSKVYKLDFIDELISYLKHEIDVNAVDLSFKFKKEKIIKTCKKCNTILNISNKSGLCATCASFLSRKVDRPSKEDLIEDIKHLGYRATGRKYGVSDNTIRSWI